MGGHCTGPKKSGPSPSCRKSKQGSWVGLRHPSQPEMEGNKVPCWIPVSGFCVSFLPPVSHQSGVGIGGTEEAKRETRPQGLLC